MAHQFDPYITADAQVIDRREGGPVVMASITNSGGSYMGYLSPALAREFGAALVAAAEMAAKHAQVPA